jgi:hypothetical protein
MIPTNKNFNTGSGVTGFRGPSLALELLLLLLIGARKCGILSSFFIDQKQAACNSNFTLCKEKYEVVVSETTH